MKKIIFFSIAFALYSTASFAQFDLGARVGMTSSIASLNDVKIGSESFDDFKSDYQTGYLLGFYARENIEKVYLQLELLFLSRKMDAQFEETSMEGVREIVTNVHSFEIPLLLGYKLIHSSVFSLNVFGGAAVDFVLSSETNVNGFEDLEVITNKTKEKLKKNDYLLIAGVGMDIWRLNFDCRYQLGVTDISEEFTNTNEEVSLERRNKGLNFTLGFKF